MPCVIRRAIAGDRLRLRPVHGADARVRPSRRRDVWREAWAVVRHAVVVDGLQQAAVVHDDAPILRLVFEDDAALGVRRLAGGTQLKRALLAGGESGDVPRDARRRTDSVDLRRCGGAIRGVDHFPRAIDLRAGGQRRFGNKVRAGGRRRTDSDGRRHFLLSVLRTGTSPKPSGGILP